MRLFITVCIANCFTVQCLIVLCRRYLECRHCVDQSMKVALVLTIDLQWLFQTCGYGSGLCLCLHCRLVSVSSLQRVSCLEVHRLLADSQYRPIGRLSASLPIIGIGHLTIGIGRLSASADNWPIICFIKQNNKKCF